MLPPAGEPTEVLPRTDEAPRVLPPADEATQVLPHVGESTEVLPRSGELTRGPAPADESTRVLSPAGEQSRVLPSAGEATEVLSPAGESARVLPPTREATHVLAPTAERTAEHTPRHTATVHLKNPTDAPAPADDGPPPADAEYSATVLASHWIQRPEPDGDGTLLEEPSGTTARPVPAGDRGDGSVLRFGPGVTAAVAHRTHRTLPAVAAPAAAPRRRLRRHALPALVVLLVLAFLAWQRLGPPVAVRTVAVAAEPAALGCGGTADIVGLVTTNGRPGTLSYRWIRSDGTASGVLHEVVVRGQRQARLHLRWTFQGEGRRTARADLRLLSPAHRPVVAHVTYACP
ncbi:hypothetical protein ACFW1F_03950 [Streptomyces bungoensis]|uniref:hypothetical protein n=1 Tax=Streptomyces bungoensis TaxID=285568 RepID=UPI00342A3C46